MNDYAVTQKVIHWLMGIFIMLICSSRRNWKFYRRSMVSSPIIKGAFCLRVDHATMGYILTALLLRVYSQPPWRAESLPICQWQVRAAHLGHVGLYMLMGALLLSGIITASAASQPIVIFATFDVAFGVADESFFQAVRRIHELCTNLMIALIAIHVGAALYHHFIARDHTTARMIRFWKRAEN